MNPEPALFEQLFTDFETIYRRVCPTCPLHEWVQREGEPEVCFLCGTVRQEGEL